MATLSPRPDFSPPQDRPAAQAAGNPFRWRTTNLIQDLFFKALLLVAPIQSVLLTPVQGTTPATVLLLGSLVLLASRDPRYFRLWVFVIGYILFYAAYLTLSLSSYYIDSPDMSQLIVIRDIFVFGWIRQTHITQGFYLLIPLLFCYLVYQFYQEAFIKYAYYGIILLSLYGFYEFTFFAIFHSNGDFLSNRNFGELDAASAGAGNSESGFASGSLLQLSPLLGPGFMRLKSLVGEPSMYALTVTPFAIYAFARGWWLIFATLALSLFLGTSTTALVGLMVGIGYAYTRDRGDAVLYLAAFLIVVALLYFTVDSVHEALDKVLFNKLDSGSGNERLKSFSDQVGVVFDGNIIRTLFGLGFGTVRSTDMLSNMLANVGFVGLFLYSAVLLAPCYLLRKGDDTNAIVGALLAVFVMEMATVSEYAYLPPWFMAALGYARARQQRLTASRARGAA